MINLLIEKYFKPFNRKRNLETNANNNGLNRKQIFLSNLLFKYKVNAINGEIESKDNNNSTEKSENTLNSAESSEVFDKSSREYIQFMKSMNFWESIQYLLNRKIDKKDPNYKKQFEKEGETGWERITNMWTEYFNGEDNPETRHMGAGFGWGALLGGLYGGVLSNKTAVQDFIRRHNEYVFKGQLEAKRQIVDIMFLQMARGGLRWAWRVSLLTGSLSVITTTAIAYRNDIHISDCMGAGALVCSLWKVKLGLRAMAVSGVVGSLLGLIFAGNLKFILWAMNTTVPEYRYWRQNRYLKHMIVEEYSDGTTEYAWPKEHNKQDSQNSTHFPNQKSS